MMFRLPSNFLLTSKLINFKKFEVPGYFYQPFRSNMSKNRSFFRENTSFTHWLITRLCGMIQLWSIPHSIAPHLLKKMRSRWTRSNKKWRQEARSKTGHHKKTPCSIDYHFKVVVGLSIKKNYRAFCACLHSGCYHRLLLLTFPFVGYEYWWISCSAVQ